MKFLGEKEVTVKFFGEKEITINSFGENEVIVKPPWKKRSHGD